MPRFLTDTHALIWWWNEDDRLSKTAGEVLADRTNAVFAPTVCAWEIASKVRIGKLPEMAPFVEDYDALVADAGFQHFDLRYDHALDAGLIAGNHRDPFDRLIAAQALRDDLTIITRDREFAAFGCKTLW